MHKLEQTPAPGAHVVSYPCTTSPPLGIPGDGARPHVTRAETWFSRRPDRARQRRLVRLAIGFDNDVPTDLFRKEPWGAVDDVAEPNGARHAIKEIRLQVRPKTFPSLYATGAKRLH